jgi:hypothetical protein
MHSKAASRGVRALVKTRLGKAELRDLAAEDVEVIVRYWHTSGDGYLDYLGIDRVRLGSTEDTRRRFADAIPTGDSNQKNLAWAITVDGSFVGYTLLDRYAPEINYFHWHITESGFCAQGLSSALYPHRIKTYFDSVPIECLIHQTRSRNHDVNRMLDNFVSVAGTRYIANPDGVALPGEFHLRYVFRRDIPRLLLIATR